MFGVAVSQAANRARGAAGRNGPRAVDPRADNDSRDGLEALSFVPSDSNSVAEALMHTDSASRGWAES